MCKNSFGWIHKQIDERSYANLFVTRKMIKFAEFTILPTAKSTWLKCNLLTATTDLLITLANISWFWKKSMKFQLISWESFESIHLGHTSGGTNSSFNPYRIWIFVWMFDRLYFGGLTLAYISIFFAAPWSSFWNRPIWRQKRSWKNLKSVIIRE